MPSQQPALVLRPWPPTQVSNQGLGQCSLAVVPVSPPETSSFPSESLVLLTVNGLCLSLLSVAVIHVDRNQERLYLTYGLQFIEQVKAGTEEKTMEECSLLAGA